MVKVIYYCVLFCQIFILFSLDARGGADSIYDRQIDKWEEQRILLYNRWFKQQREMGYPCWESEEVMCPYPFSMEGDCVMEKNIYDEEL